MPLYTMVLAEKEQTYASASALPSTESLISAIIAFSKRRRAKKSDRSNASPASSEVTTACSICGWNSFASGPSVSGATGTSRQPTKVKPVSLIAVSNFSLAVAWAAGC